MAAVTDSQQSGHNSGLVSLAQRSTTVAVQKSDSSGSQGQGTTDNKFQKYLNTAQALHQMGVIVPSLETWPGKPSTGIATRAGGGVSVQAATRQSSSTNEDLPNVITQLYHTSTSQLAYLNGQIVVMGSNAVPSLWYWVVDERTTSGRATWWAHTELNWGTDKQKQFVENQLGFKDDSNSSLTNFKSQGLTQPAYLIAGLDVVQDHLVFAAFKAGAVGYDMSTENSAATKDQALAWSTTAGL
ncbi:MgpC family cytadherence protein, partial [Mycoplasmoides pneumoniae]